MKKEEIKIKQGRLELIIISILSILIVAALIIKQTYLNDIKIVEILTGLVVSNIWNLGFVIILLGVIYYVKKKNLLNEINKIGNTKESEKECEK